MSITVIPPTKLLSAPCMASVMATLADASNVRKLVRGTPIMPAAVSMTVMYSIIFSRFSRNPLTVGSIFLNRALLDISLNSQCTRNKPTTSAMMPPSRFTP